MVALAQNGEEKVNILLVDDQQARLLSYETILAGLGQNLVRARSGLEALERLMSDDFAVVLLDVSMPGMDGFETASLIHDHPRYEKTPIIFVTGVAITELDRLKGYKLGAVDYVAIPVVPEILRSKVEVLVELYCKRRELQVLNRNLEQANTTLQAEKNRELEKLNETLKAANTELEHTNRALQSEIAERVRVESALKEADRHKDEFLAMLAHELRNPLAPIFNAIQIMRRKSIQDPQLSWSRDVIERQLKHLTRLVDDLLDVSRITRGKINVTQGDIELTTIVSRAIETVQPMLTEKRHELTVHVPNTAIVLQGDLTRLTQAVGNVLGNAAKYTDPGGQIQLSALERGSYVEIRIKDNGIGIPAEMLPSVFDLFTQLDRTSDRTQGGLGIGLALVRKLVEMHDGTVTAHSEGAGLGSEFLIRLPHTAGSASVVDIQDCVAPVARAGRRILVADDNRDALESLATLLQLNGHEVHTAADGAAAVELAAICKPEVALLDLGMPKLDGYEVARRIRAEIWGRTTVIVALTGWGQDEDRRRTKAAGFDSHFVKPLDMDVLSKFLAKLG